MHRVKRPEAHPRRNQTSPTVNTWSPQNGNPSQQPPPQRPYNMNYRRTSTETFNSSGPASTILTPQTPSVSGLPSSQTVSQSNFAGLSAHSVPDLSAMMFPTSDPFAYPNQPMTTLENQSYIKQEEGIYSPSISSTSAGPPPYQNQNFDAQFNGLQNFVMPPASQPQPQQQPDWSMQGMTDESLTMNGNEDMAGMGASWPPPQQQNSTTRGIPPGQGSYDQIFGEDWGGWMNQGYRQ